MDSDVLAFAERLDLDRGARGLWDAAVPHLAAAVRGEDAGFLGALEGVSHSAALSSAQPLAALLDAYNEGCTQLCRRLEESGASEARDICLRLRSLDKAALSHIATGFCSGLEETLERLRRAAEAEAPADVETGALRPQQLMARVALEADRCRRADSPLGLVAFGLVPRSASEGRRSLVAREVARRLRGGLRCYDSLGTTTAGDLVVVMPDVGRHGLVAAAERLVREVGRPSGRDPAPEIVCTFFHYDEVDTEPPAMLANLGQSLDAARSARGRVAS